MNGEQALLISHFSSFHIEEVDEAAIGTKFQDWSIDNEPRKVDVSISSFKDAQQVVERGSLDVWGQVVNLQENKNRNGLGFFAQNKSMVKPEFSFRSYCEKFYNA